MTALGFGRDLLRYATLAASAEYGPASDTDVYLAPTPSPSGSYVANPVSHTGHHGSPRQQRGGADQEPSGPSLGSGSCCCEPLRAVVDTPAPPHTQSAGRPQQGME